MANILGIDYYRVVSETGDEQWSQVYVKTAFDEEELARFGSIFGIVKLSGKGDLVANGMELIGKLDRWCDEAAHKGDVAGLLDLLKNNLATGAFVWVYVDGKGTRRIKAGALSGNGIAILRGGNRYWLFENGDGRVVSGELKEKDRLFLGSREAVELIDKEMTVDKNDMEVVSEAVTAEMMKLSEGARAALILTIKPAVFEVEKGVDWPPFVRSTSLRTTEGSPPYGLRGVSGIKEAVIKRIEKRQEETLVGHRVVGGEGLTGKFQTAKVSWKDLMQKMQTAGKLREGREDGKRHKLVLLVGAIFLVMLGVSVSFGLVKMRADRAKEEYKMTFEPLEKKRLEAESLYNLNPVGARDLLRGVKEELTVKKAGFVGTEFEPKIVEFEELVESTWAKVSGEQKISLDQFFNLGLVRSGMKGERMGFDGKNLLVLDKTLGIIAKVSFPDKKQEVTLGKGEGQNWTDVAGTPSNSIVLSKSNMIGLFSGTRGETTFDAAVTDPVAVDMFGTAAYVLDKGSSEIWRFGLAEGTIGERRRWLVSEVEADLRGGADLAIDSDIWVGVASGKILRFRRGQPEKFNMTDGPADFAISRLAVSSDNQVVAVLDSQKGRIVLFNKETGAYMKQMLADEFASATDMVWVSDHELMVISGDKLLVTSI
jgi:hypothetical protein